MQKNRPVSKDNCKFETYTRVPVVKNMPDTQEIIDGIAADWVARLSLDTLSTQDREQLDHWLAEDSRHQDAFAEAHHALSLMEASLAFDAVADPAQSPRSEPPANQNADIIAFAPQKSLNKEQHPTSRKMSWKRISAVAAVLALALLGGRVWIGDPVIYLSADYHTAPGEISAVTLSDGSVVTLGPASALRVDFDDNARRIELLAGQADFRAKPMEDAGNRPFIVSAHNGTARALGTRFIVDERSDYVTVSVLEHDVEVAIDTFNPGTVEKLVVSPGRSVRYDARSLGPLEDINPDRIVSWQHGKMIFDRVALREVVAQFARYHRGEIIIANEAVAKRYVSGVFETSDPQNVIDIVARELGIQKISVTPLLTILY